MSDNPLIRELDVHRHWHRASEPYTGGDSLATALRNGWALRRVVSQEKCQHTHRCVTVYHFELARSGETVVMAVISNPWIERLIISLDIIVVPATQHETNNLALPDSAQPSR